MIEGRLQYNRREFLRMLALGSASIYLSACGTEDTSVDEEQKILDTASVRKSPDADKPELKNSNDVTWYKRGDEQYELLRKGHNKRIEKFPAVIALCSTTVGVQQAIVHAKENNLPVAIKSGGHSMEGFSCNNDGLVINLSRLNKIEWEDEEIIRVGPACTLAQLNAELLPQKRQIPAGSCGGVAVGGLTLGGGYGMFSRKLGLTCDSLIEVTMVDGEGKIRNSKDEPELLWACRGGGSGNFGVITEMKFKTHEAAPHLISHRFRKFKCTVEEAVARLEKWFELSVTLPEHSFSGFVLNGKTVFILLTTAGEETDEVKRVFAEFESFSDKVSKGEAKSLPESLTGFYGIQYPIYYKNASVGFYKDFNDVKDIIAEAFEKVQSTTGMIYAVNTLGGKIKDAEAEKKSAFAHREYNFISELQTYWKKEEQEKKILASFNETRKLFTSNGITAEYINYPDINLENWEKSYYGKNYQRLQEVKRKYDPENLIRYEQSVRLSND